MEQDGTAVVAGTDCGDGNQFGTGTGDAWPAHVVGVADKAHDWWTWHEPTGEVKYYLPTSNHDSGSEANADKADNQVRYEDATDELMNLSKSDPPKTDLYQAADMGYSALDTTKPHNNFGAGVQATPTTDRILTLTDWNKLTAPEKTALMGHAWIYDESDGWAYWAGALAPGQATGLLLSGITLSVQPEANDFKYVIYADLQTATADELAKFGTEGRHLSAAAATLLASFDNEAPTIADGQGVHEVSDAGGTPLELPVAGWFRDFNTTDTLTYQLVTTGLPDGYPPAVVHGTTPTLGDDGQTLTYTIDIGDTADTPAVIYVQAVDQFGLTSPLVQVLVTADI
jgi:hypothetical protein